VTSPPLSGKNSRAASLQKVLKGIEAQQSSLNEQQKKLSEWREQVLAQQSASRQGINHDDSCMNTSCQQTPAGYHSVAHTSSSVDSDVPLDQVMATDGSPGLSSITHSRGRLAGKKDSGKKQPSSGKSPDGDHFPVDPAAPKLKTPLLMFLRKRRGERMGLRQLQVSALLFKTSRVAIAVQSSGNGSKSA